MKYLQKNQIKTLLIETRMYNYQLYDAIFNDINNWMATSVADPLMKAPAETSLFPSAEDL